MRNDKDFYSIYGFEVIIGFSLKNDVKVNKGFVEDFMRNDM